jgi:hypothetical protein
MNQSLTIALPKNMPLVRRISETSKKINEWLHSFEVKFDDEKDKLHLKKMEIKNQEYRYSYSIISRKGLSVGAVNSGGDSYDIKTPDNPVASMQIEEPLAEIFSN